VFVKKTSDSFTSENTFNAPQVTEAVESTWKSGPIVGFLSALVAGLFAWLIVQLVHPLFATTKGADEWGFLPRDVQWILDRNNSIFVLALFGGVSAAGIAVSEELHRKSWQFVLTIAGICAVIGVLFGGLAGFLGHLTFEFLKHNQEIADVNKAIGVYGVMFAVGAGGIGLGCGAFLSGSYRLSVQCLIAGMLAGLLAAVAYTCVVALLLPSALTFVLFPTEAADRMLWFGCFAGFVGLILPTMLRQRAPISF
jgi:hypothetical protein